MAYFFGSVFGGWDVLKKVSTLKKVSEGTSRQKAITWLIGVNLCIGLGLGLTQMAYFLVRYSVDKMFLSYSEKDIWGNLSSQGYNLIGANLCIRVGLAQLAYFLARYSVVGSYATF